MPTTTGKATELITFTRGTLATVTDADGKIKWAPHNLLTNSESFDASSWGLSGLLAFGSGSSANATAAPNSTTTADYLRETNTSARHFIYAIASTIAGANYTARVFVKASERTFVALGIRTTDGVTGYAAVINLSTGAVTTTSTTGSPTNVSAPAPVDVGGGWYLVSVSMDATTSNAYVEFGLSDSATPSFSSGMPTYTGTGTSGLYLWGAHLYRSDIGGMQANTSAYPMYNPTTPKNLLGYSEDFSNAAWTKNYIRLFGSGSVANAIAAPNGSLSADKIVVDTNNGLHVLYNTSAISVVSGTTYTGFIYVKAAEYGFAFVALNVRSSSSNCGVCVNLADGSWSNAGANGTYTVTSAGDGWWLVSIRATASTTNGYLEITPRATAGGPVAYTGDGTSGIYLWGAQLSDSASLDAYSPVFGAAPSAAAYHGPRLDYDPVTLACKGLLVEEQRTNLVLQSAAFDTWLSLNILAFGSGSVANAIASPDGTVTADFIVPDTTSNQHGVYRSVTTVSGTAYTSSVYAKAGGYNWLYMTEANNVTAQASFNLSTGVLGTVSGTGSPSATITAVGNGWYRCTLTFTPISTTSNIQCRANNADGGIPFTGNGTSGIYLYGAQAEAGSFATSYIPTGAATATRSADVASVGVSQFPYSATEGTLVVSGDFSGIVDTPAAGFVAMTDGTPTGSPSSSYAVLWKNTTLAVSGRRSTAGAVTNITVSNTTAANTVIKLGTAFSVNGTDALSVNGGAVATQAGVTSAYTDTIMRIGNFGVNPAYLNGHIRQITYIPRRLTNAELQARTA